MCRVQQRGQCGWQGVSKRGYRRDQRWCRTRPDRTSLDKVNILDFILGDMGKHWKIWSQGMQGLSVILTPLWRRRRGRQSVEAGRQAEKEWIPVVCAKDKSSLDQGWFVEVGKRGWIQDMTYQKLTILCHTCNHQKKSKQKLVPLSVGYIAFHHKPLYVAFFFFKLCTCIILISKTFKFF